MHSRKIPSKIFMTFTKAFGWHTFQSTFSLLPCGQPRWGTSRQFAWPCLVKRKVQGRWAFLEPSDKTPVPSAQARVLPSCHVLGTGSNRGDCLVWWLLRRASWERCLHAHGPPPRTQPCLNFDLPLRHSPVINQSQLDADGLA